MKKILFGLVLTIFAFSACRTQATSAPVPTNTPLPHPTETPVPPTLSPTPTLTPTSTPIPTPTLPFEIPSLATGTGTVIGLVLWNGEPVAKNMVNLCASIRDNGCYGKRYSTKSNSQGYYMFANVEPGEYVVTINMFSVGWYYVVDGSGVPKYDTVKADEITILDPFDTYKVDLKTTYPHGRGAVVVYETQPTLKWDEYPHADYYIVEMNETGWLGQNGYGCTPGSSLESPKIEDGQTSFMVSPPLEIGSQYYWCVIAYNKSGTKIAEGFGAPFYVLNP